MQLRPRQKPRNSTSPSQTTPMQTGSKDQKLCQTFWRKPTSPARSPTQHSWKQATPLKQFSRPPCTPPSTQKSRTHRPPPTPLLGSTCPPREPPVSRPLFSEQERADQWGWRPQHGPRTP
uniref:Uncharacterized protein n=1 Tax=Avian infectious bursal disease virus TaxID=10995 RepID=A0A6H2AAK7_IBDV|nr:hypothetical protein [Infectious bursal disease virus]